MKEMKAMESLLRKRASEKSMVSRRIFFSSAEKVVWVRRIDSHERIPKKKISSGFMFQLQTE